MSRAATFFLFLGSILLVVGGTHFYFWLRLVRDTALASPWRPLATGLLAGAAFSLPASFLLSRLLPLSLARVLLLPIYIWMGLMVLLLLLLLAGDLTRLCAWLAARAGIGPDLVSDATRRLLLRRGIALAALLIAAGTTTVAMRVALGGIVVRQVRVTLPGLPRALSGTTLVQLTDFHLGPTLGRRWLQGVVDEVRSLRPDLVAITGDLVDGSVDKLRQEVVPLAMLRAPFGVFFVTGNHEYYSGVESWLAELGRLGLRVLHNERVTIGSPAASFDLAGIDDDSARGMAPGHGADLERALAGRDPRRALVLLAHQPRRFSHNARRGIGLQLSGHTHGGQFWPWTFFVRLQQRFLAGLHHLDGAQLYVSEGTGFWGPPLRLGTRSEITRITLISP